LKLIFMDGWWIGLRRILHFLQTATHPEDLFGLKLPGGAWNPSKW
jgi:hypothetical protein